MAASGASIEAIWSQGSRTKSWQWQVLGSVPRHRSGLTTPQHSDQRGIPDFPGSNEHNQGIRTDKQRPLEKRRSQTFTDTVDESISSILQRDRPPSDTKIPPTPNTANATPPDSLAIPPLRTIPSRLTISENATYETRQTSAIRRTTIPSLLLAQRVFSVFMMLARAWHCILIPTPNFCQNHSWSVLSTFAFLDLIYQKSHI